MQLSSILLLLAVALFGLSAVEAATLSVKKHLQSKSSVKAHVKKGAKAAVKGKQEPEGDDDDDSDDDSDDSDDGMINSTPAAPVAVAPPVAPAPVAPAPVAPAPAKPAAEEELSGEEKYPGVEVPHPWDELEGHLSEVQTRQSQLKSELKIWADHSTWDSKISKDKEALAKETTAALADMLSDIRGELHQLAVPVYTDVLYDNLSTLGEKEHYLKREIEHLKEDYAEHKDHKKSMSDIPEGPEEVKELKEEVAKERKQTLFMDAMFVLFGIGFGAIAVVLLRAATGL